MEHNVDRVLEKAFARQKSEMPRREIVLKARSPKGVWLAAAATVAVGLLLTIRQPAPEPEFVCWVDGVRIEDRDEATEIARLKLAEVDEKVRLSMVKVNEIINPKK